MEKITKLKVMNLLRLNNAEFKTFLEQFYKLIPVKANESDIPTDLSVRATTEPDSTFVGISDADKALFNADMELLTDAINQSTINDNTALLNELDKQRGQIISFILNAITNGRNSPNADYASAATSLYNIVKPYRGIQNYPIQQETAQVQGLLYDLRKEENSTKTALLNLNEAMETLETVNEKFSSLSSVRINELSTTLNEKTKSIRSRMIGYYNTMSLTVFSYGVSNKTEEALTFVNNLNSLIDKTNSAYNLRRSIAAANKSKANSGSSGSSGSDYEDKPGEL